MEKQSRYLGCYFTNIPDQKSIIDPIINYAIFKNNFLTVHQKLSFLINKHSSIPFSTKIRFIHTFSEPHTALFAQTIPHFQTKIWQINILFFKFIAKFLALDIPPNLNYTLSKFTGLIPPKWKWISKKLMFFSI